MRLASLAGVSLEVRRRDGMRRKIVCADRASRIVNRPLTIATHRACPRQCRRMHPCRSRLLRQPNRSGSTDRPFLRAVKAGKISGTRDDAGVWHVDPAELFRVFEPAQPEAEAEPQHALANALVAELRARLDDMRRTVEDVRRDRDQRIADLARERDEWREEAKRLSLPAPTPMRAAAAPHDMEQGRGAADEESPANGPVRAAAAPSIAADAAQPAGRLRRTWRWLRSTG